MVGFCPSYYLLRFWGLDTDILVSYRDAFDSKVFGVSFKMLWAVIKWKLYILKAGLQNASGFLALKMATWSLPNTFLKWFYWLVDTSIIYLLAYLYNIAVKAWIYHSMSQNCLERDRSMPNRLGFADSNYWAKTFLGTAGAMVPIFLRSCPKGGLSD